MFLSRTTLHSSSTIWVGAGTTNATASPTLETVNLADADSAVITAVVDVTNPSAGAFTGEADDDLCTKTAHGFPTGLKVQVSNSGGALPTGLSAATDYFVINVSANTFKLATSLANALAGTGIDLTGDGSGTQTVTPTTLAAAAIKLQASIDNRATWFDVPGETRTITADATEVFELDYIRYPDYRIYPTLSAGYMTVAAVCLPKKGA